MAALITEYPVGTRGQTIEQALGAQEINVGKGTVEEEALYARRKTDQVEQELLTIGSGVQFVKAVD